MRANDPRYWQDQGVSLNKYIQCYLVFFFFFCYKYFTFIQWKCSKRNVDIIITDIALAIKIDSLFHSLWNRFGLFIFELFSATISSHDDDINKWNENVAFKSGRVICLRLIDISPKIESSWWKFSSVIHWFPPWSLVSDAHPNLCYRNFSETSIFLLVSDPSLFADFRVEIPLCFLCENVDEC